MSNSDIVCLGEIVGTHGVRGELKVNTFTEFPESLTEYGDLQDERGNLYPLTIRFVKGSVAVVKCPHVTNPEDGKLLRGTKLYVPRHMLPEADESDGFYIDDLIGLVVKDPSGKNVATVKFHHNFGAGDILELAYPNQKTEMFLFDEMSFPTIDIEAGFIVFHHPEAR